MIIQNFLNTYDFPIKDVELMKSAIAYWESNHLGKTVNIKVIQLATDVRDTHVDIEDIPDFSIDESTRALAQLRGSELVYDSSNNNLNYYCLIKVG